MKKILTLFFFTAIAVMRSSAFDFEITTTKTCMNDGIAAVLSITSPDTSVSYKWQEYNYQTDVWVTIDSNHTSVTVDHVGQYRSTCWKNGSFKKSNQIILCSCLPLALSPFDIIGGYLTDGHAVLQFAELRGYSRVTLQFSDDLQRSWQDIKNVTGDVLYISNTKISGTVFYRLEVTDADGVQHYSSMPFKIKYVENSFDFQKPYTAEVTEMSGRTTIIEGEIAVDARDAYRKISAKFHDLFPVVKCTQNGKTITLVRCYVK